MAIEMMNRVLKDIFSRMDDMGISQKSMAKSIGIDETSFCKKKKAKRFKFEEVCKMCEEVGLELILQE